MRGLVNNKNYPEIADDFARSIKTCKSLPADVFLGAHSWFFDLAGKYKRLGSATNPYIDPAGYKSVGRQHGKELQHRAYRAEDSTRQLTSVVPAVMKPGRARG